MLSSQVLYCMSTLCYEKIYGTDVLEDGEYDMRRSLKFKECMKSIMRICKINGLAPEDCNEFH